MEEEAQGTPVMEGSLGLANDKPTQQLESNPHSGQLKKAHQQQRPKAAKNKEHSNPRQYSCLENPKDRGEWQVAVHRVAESDLTEVT